jgi:chromosome segregation ATPase
LIEPRKSRTQLRDEFSALQQKCAQLEEQVESLGGSQRRTQQELTRARAIDARRLEDIARLEAQLR